MVQENTTMQTDDVYLYCILFECMVQNEFMVMDITKFVLLDEK